MHAILNSCTNFIQAWFSQDCLLCGALSGPQILCATCHASLPRPTNGLLEPWARQGVLLLNTTLTVRQGQANSHSKRGWDQFTDAMILAIADRSAPAIFVLWGGQAQQKIKLITATAHAARHTIIQSAHPSPLSARTGFFGSKPFSRINAAWTANGEPPIDWALD